MIDSVREKQRSGRHNMALDILEIYLAWFHSCLLERSANSPVGVSRRYEFLESDLLAVWDIVNTEVHGEQMSPEVMDNIGNMLMSSCYGCHLELDIDQDIVRALVRDIFNTARFQVCKDNAVLVTGGANGSGEVWIPIRGGKRDQFMRELSFEPNPEWCHKPLRSTLDKHTREGVSAMKTTVQLCEKAIGTLHELDGTSSSPQSRRNLKTLQMIICDMLSANSRKRMILGQDKDALARFWNTEGRIIEEVMEQLSGDLNVLTDEKRRQKMTLRLKQLMDELEEMST